LGCALGKGLLPGEGEKLKRTLLAIPEEGRGEKKIAAGREELRDSSQQFFPADRRKKGEDYIVDSSAWRRKKASKKKRRKRLYLPERKRGDRRSSM